MKNWLILISSLPTENATARMRAWRAIKASGAAVLRDGVYLLPGLETCRQSLQMVAADVIANQGMAYVLNVDEPADARFQDAFSRDAEYASLLEEAAKLQAEMTAETLPAATKSIRKLRKAFAAIGEIDFFPTQAKSRVDAALRELETAASRLLSPNEPHPATTAIAQLAIADYQGRTWATRARPWVDRLASAWLIRRFIDPHARILWLAHPGDCPAEALGFDFDGAAFSHVGQLVTYEVLLASFGLGEPALQRIGALVHYLDIGGAQPPEAVGVESVLAGARQTVTDDDQLLAIAASVFDGLLASYGGANA